MLSTLTYFNNVTLQQYAKQILSKRILSLMLNIAINSSAKLGEVKIRECLKNNHLSNCVIALWNQGFMGSYYFKFLGNIKYNSLKTISIAYDGLFQGNYMNILARYSLKLKILFLEIFPVKP